MSFGVYAEQIEELLEDRVLSESEEASTEYTLLYKGQDIRVINFSKWIEKEQGIRNEKHFEPHFSCLIPETREFEDIYDFSSKILIVKHRNEQYIGVRVDDLKDLATVSIKQVHSLPLIMQKTKRIQGLWGIALVKNRPIILIDLAQL
jgi:chemotaxis signal transduction protein